MSSCATRGASCGETLPVDSERTPRVTRAVAWRKDDPLRVEFAEINIADRRLTVNGVAIGTSPLPHRLDYELETGTEYVTARLYAASRGEGWGRELELRRDSTGTWSIATDQHGDVDLPPPG